MLEISDRSSDGLLEITDTGRDRFGSVLVTVRELIGNNCWVGGFPLRRARRLARRAVEGNISSCRVINRFAYGGCDHVTFLVVPSA